MTKTRGNLILIGPSRLVREGLKPALRKCQLVVSGEGKNLSEARPPSILAAPPDAVICILSSSRNVDGVIEDIREARDQFPRTKLVVVSDFLSHAEVLRAFQAGVNAILSPDISLSLLLNSLELVLLGQQLFPAFPLNLIADPVGSPLISEGAFPHKGPPVEASSLLTFSRRPHAAIQEAVPLIVSDPATAASAPQAPAATPTAVSEIADGVGPPTLSDRESQILRCLVSGFPNKVIARQLGIAETTVKVHVKSVLRKARASNRTQAAIWGLNYSMIVASAAPDRLAES